VVYAHHGDLDTIGHLWGPGTDPWCAELARIDDTLARTTDTLPDEVALVVTADHGMVHVPPDGFVELADEAWLLAGVRMLTGDARARQLHTRPGATDEVVAAWREHAADRAHVVTRDEAIEAGWFGDRVDDRVRPLIGDVIVSARAPDVAWVHRDIDPFGGRLAGQHGALTPDELEVPALVLTRRTR
jgi:predicted AlkP superfamily pyrophosphatase or phosphodiesterase